MSVGGESLLSALFDTLYGKLASPELRDLATTDEEKQVLLQEINSWEAMLRNIHAGLDDAERLQIENDINFNRSHDNILHELKVREWSIAVQDLAYDVDDILEVYVAKALRSKLMQQEFPATTSKVHKLLIIPTCLPNSLIKNCSKSSKTTADQVKKITARLEELAKQKSELNLTESGVVRRKKTIIPRNILATTTFLGRDREVADILDLVLRNNRYGSDEDGVSFIPVVGEAGLGKRSLAWNVYNDDRIQKHFGLKAWVHDTYHDSTRIAKAVLEAVTGKPSDIRDLYFIQIQLKDKLANKKFLLVLDDLHLEDGDDWAILRSTLVVGNRGSRILFTSLDSFSSLQHTDQDQIYYLNSLSKDSCMSLLARHALGERDFSKHMDLKETAGEIVERCRGWPLAVKHVGGVLQTMVATPDEWKHVLNSLSHVGRMYHIHYILRWSYHYLPSHLKQCFNFCSILPPGYEFGEEEIVLLWMAVGLVQSKEKGCQYFKELVSRSFFEIFQRGGFRFTIHPQVGFLASSAAKEFCKRMGRRMQTEIFHRPRHLSYLGELSSAVLNLEDVKLLQTFLAFIPPSDSDHYISKDALGLLLKLRSLRVLSLSGYSITKLPDSIGDLIHLRYLDCSRAKIKSLPGSVCTLLSLQTLLLRHCWALEELPSEIGRLINLCHLDITEPLSLKGMPEQIGKLTNLCTLSNFVVAKGNGSQLGLIKSLLSLKGQLVLSGLENVDEIQYAQEAKLQEKSDLTVLKLKWSDQILNGAVAEELFNCLQPHKNLEELTVDGYKGSIFPAWLGDPSFENLQSLCIQNCQSCESLPSVGSLPLLRKLHIVGMSGITSIGAEFYEDNWSNAFPSLETLHFEDMVEWKEWKNHEADEQTANFRCLHMLSFVNCPQLLGSLPNCLLQLKTLVVRQCKQLVVSVSSFPLLCELQIEGCKEVACGTRRDFKFLKTVSFSDIPTLISLPKWMMLGLKQAEHIRIEGCKKLSSLWQNNFGLLAHLRSLRDLEISYCPQLVSFGAKEELAEEEERLQLASSSRSTTIDYLTIAAACERVETTPRSRVLPIFTSLTGISFFLTLKRLVIYNCKSLRCLLDEGEKINISNTSKLEHLEIESCPSLESLSSSGELPAMLQCLEITDCQNLTHLSSQGNLPSQLQRLHVDNCPKLTSLSSSNGNLPMGLKQLHIIRCHNLEFIAQDVRRNACLESIIISGCKSIQSFPQGLDSQQHVKRIWVIYCPQLVSLVEPGSQSLKLEELKLVECKKLKAELDLVGFHELEISACPDITALLEGCTYTLTSLCISKPNLYESILGTGAFGRFEKLKSLTIEGCCPDETTFPPPNVWYWGLFPNSLTHLTLRDFPKLEFLSSKNRQSAPNLKYLSIIECPKLASLPKKDVMSGVVRLHIDDCPLLKKQLQKATSYERSKIAHIPYVQLDDAMLED